MIRLGFVGLGLIGARRAKIVQALGYHIVFAVDPDARRRGAIIEDGCCYASSIEELDERHSSAADAILIAVPHDLARSTSLWALDKGAHVLCEKPMGLTLAQAKGMATAATAAGKHFATGFNYRYLSGVAALRQVVREGKLGKLLHVRLAMGHGGRPGMEREWKLKLARAGGGALIDPGIHLVDLAVHLFGANATETVLLRRQFWPSDVEDFCVLSLRGRDGADIAIETSLTSWKNQFVIEVYGSDGMAVLTGRGGNYGVQRLEYNGRWFWQGGENKQFEQEFGGDDLSFELETKAFLTLVSQNIHDGILSLAPDGCAALALVDQAYQKNGPIEVLV